MNNQNKRQQNNCVETLLDETIDRFDFDVWASAVKHQMIASLRKKGNEREVRSNKRN